MPTLTNIKRRNGVAGQYEISVDVQYPDEPTSTVRFIGSTYGAPIVMCTPGNPDGVFVSSSVTERIGSKLTPEWVTAFFADH